MRFILNLGFENHRWPVIFPSCHPQNGPSLSKAPTKRQPPKPMVSSARRQAQLDETMRDAADGRLMSKDPHVAEKTWPHNRRAIPDPTPQTTQGLRVTGGLTWRLFRRALTPASNP